MFVPLRAYASSSFDPECSHYSQFQQGKVTELKAELTSGGKKDKNHSAKKIALKKIVANMTMSNNDMAELFGEIIICMQIPSLEIKKMYDSEATNGVCNLARALTDIQSRCFLFLVNYARQKAETALKALPILQMVRLSSRTVDASG